MLIVDSQIHLWKNPTGPAHHRAKPLEAPELIREMDKAGVARAINCPPLWDPEGMALAAQAATEHPARIATMGWFPLKPQGDAESLRGWNRQPGMLGLRFAVLDEETRNWMLRGELDWVWEAAQRFGIPVALAVPNGLAAITRVARQFPDLRLAVDHMGAGGVGKVPDAFAHFPELLQMAGLPNVAVKMSAAPGYATDGYPFRSVHPWLRQLYDAYGPQRLFWGTDISRMPCSWRECITMFTEELYWLKGEDLAQVMGLALCDWLRWPAS